MGSPDYGVSVLKKLAEKFEIVAIYTQPDRPAGRGRKLTPTPVKVEGEKLGVPVFTPTSLRGEGEKLKRLAPDFIVTAAYGLILPREVLEVAIPINLHGSLLPKYRGASPIQAAILNGDRWTGVTAIKMVERLDAGPILGWSYTEVGSKTAPELYYELGEMAGELAVEVIENFDRLQPQPQPDCLATYAPKISKRDGLISFKMGAEEIWRKYLAYYHWPKIFTPDFKIVELELVAPTGHFGAPGEVVEVNRREGWGVVACGEGAIKIVKVQPPSRRPIPFVSYLNTLEKAIKNLV